MNIKLSINTMKAAERLSNLCKVFPYEMSLNAGNTSADPKSTLGVLAMMYVGQRNVSLNTGDMPDEVMPEFTDCLSPFILKEEAV